MNRFIAQVEKACQTLTVFLVGLAFVVSIALFTFIPQASAKDLTPEASSYEVEGADYQVDIKTPRESAPMGSTELNRNVKSNIQDALDNVREKLNLDEPIYSGTKEFIKDVEERVDETVDTVIGK